MYLTMEGTRICTMPAPRTWYHPPLPCGRVLAPVHARSIMYDAIRRRRTRARPAPLCPSPSASLRHEEPTPAGGCRELCTYACMYLAPYDQIQTPKGGGGWHRNVLCRLGAVSLVQTYGLRWARAPTWIPHVQVLGILGHCQGGRRLGASEWVSVDDSRRVWVRP